MTQYEEDVWMKLLHAGIVQGTAPRADKLESPWYVKLLLAVSGWIASLFLIGVLAMVILGGSGSIPGVILGAATITILNLQVLQGFSLYLNELRQSDAIIPLINFAWKDLSTQLDPAKYQRLLFGLILILMMIFRPAGLIPAKRRERKLEQEETE